MVNDNPRFSSSLKEQNVAEVNGCEWDLSPTIRAYRAVLTAYAYRPYFCWCSVNCCKQAFSQACAVCSPEAASISAMAMLRQLRIVLRESSLNNPNHDAESQYGHPVFTVLPHVICGPIVGEEVNFGRDVKGEQGCPE